MKVSVEAVVVLVGQEVGLFPLCTLPLGGSASRSSDRSVRLRISAFAKAGPGSQRQKRMPGAVVPTRRSLPTTAYGRESRLEKCTTPVMMAV